MSDVNKINGISAQLKAEVEKAMPKKGQKFTFVSIRAGARGTTVLPYDTIWDPYAGEDESGAMVDIAFIKGAVAQMGNIGNIPSNELKHIRNLDRIQFTKADGGRINVTGGDRRGEQLFTFLYLTSQTRNTKDKPWYVARPGKQPVCYMQEPEKTATERLEFSRYVRQAGQAIDDMPNEKLRDFALALDMKGITGFSSPDQIRVQLLNIAAVDPKKVLSLDKDESLKVRLLVKEAEKLGIIAYDPSILKYTWPEHGGLICTVPIGSKPQDIMVTYLMDKGSSVKDTLRSLVDIAKADKKKTKGK